MSKKWTEIKKNLSDGLVKDIEGMLNDLIGDDLKYNRSHAGEYNDSFNSDGHHCICMGCNRVWGANNTKRIMREKLNE